MSPRNRRRLPIIANRSAPRATPRTPLTTAVRPRMRRVPAVTHRTRASDVLHRVTGMHRRADRRMERRADPSAGRRDRTLEHRVRRMLRLTHRARRNRGTPAGMPRLRARQRTARRCASRAPPGASTRVRMITELPLAGTQLTRLRRARPRPLTRRAPQRRRTPTSPRS
jgi:hypothetical protein